MDYVETMDSLGGILEEDLTARLGKSVEEGRRYHPFIGEAYEAIREFVLRGGRRLVACSVLMTYKGYKGQLDESIVGSCSGIEFFRHSILVHDDIADSDDMRRGGPTLHKALGEAQEKIGLDTAMFAGNALYAMALDAIITSQFPYQDKEKTLKIISSAYREINESQILDAFFEAEYPGVDDWGVMASRRASSLFKTAMLTGAILAGVPLAEQKLLEEAAKHIGYAFDIQDDIIDTFASSDQYGREPCGDVYKGKKPLHIILALSKDSRLRPFMKLGRVLTHQEIEMVREILRSSGALEEAKSISRMHARVAEELISRTGMSLECKEFFTTFLRYIVDNLEWYR